MNLVIFGLTISSSWGNGHATLWRGLCRALAARGHKTTFFELNTPYYAAHRDMVHPSGCDLRIYDDWPDVRREAALALRNADVGLVTSFCPDAQAATNLLLDSSTQLKAYYDLDTPVTLHEIDGGSPPSYVPDCGLGPFDLVLSYTGGRALDDLVSSLGARRVAPLYGSVDPDIHRPVAPNPKLQANLSYLGTYAADRQAALDRLFLRPAKERGALKFAGDEVIEIQVKRPDATSHWVWGAFKMTGAILAELHALWCTRNPQDEYVGTLVNAWLAAGGRARGICAGTSYVDVGTVRGYREAISLLSPAADNAETLPAVGSGR